MGHVRLGVLPASKKWKEIVNYLGGGSVDVAVLANKVAEACDIAFEKAIKDPAFGRVLQLMLRVPEAAKAIALKDSLNDLGVTVPDNPSRTDIIVGFNNAITAEQRKSGQDINDISELAKMAGVSVFNEFMSREAPPPQMDFFTEPKSEVHRNLERLASPEGFADLTQSFCAELAKKNIRYFMDREMPNQIGAGKAFASIPDLALFDQSVDQHCKEASFIMRPFANDFYAKNKYGSGVPITDKAMQNFGKVTMNKIRKEFHIRNQDASI